MTLHYVPAGVEAYTQTPRQLHISNKPNAEETSEHGKRLKIWRTKYKTVVFSGSSANGCTYVPDADYDVVVPLGSPTFIKNCGLTKILANPIHGPFCKIPFASLGVESIVDSGGFQLLRGLVDFVEPDDLVKLYNKDADIGMPLDLPVPHNLEPMFFDSVSKMIRANDDYMIKKLKGVDLALISHGSTLELRKSRLDVLDRKAAVVAVAGLSAPVPAGIDPVVNALENLMYVVHRYHKSARYFHVLGVTSKFWLFIYALLDSSGYVKSIGADSVSHRLRGFVGQYNQYDFNCMQLGKKLSYHMSAPCNCPVCFAVDDLRIISYAHILEAHNLWVRAQWTKMLSDLATQYVKGVVSLADVYKVLDLQASLNEFTKLVSYVESIISTNKFRPLRTKATRTSLFQARVFKAHPKQEIYGKVLDRYEVFHGKKFR